ncbi:2-C-methyl-D-erythritol 2,4-cyclodiphosphate synthase [Oscillospiraceae bacterium PP1C4]
MRIGHGYDAHRLANDRKLILGGIEIPYDRGLLGYSDADVLTHAVIDAILGALAMGDIGRLFPDNDPQYEGADSIKLLGKVRLLMEELGWQIGNLDVTVIAQEPKLKPYIEQMRKTVAQTCAAQLGDVNIKATTEERMGFTGSGEGISAHAVCVLQSK